MRTIYWARAMDVWGEHRLAGAGAGSFAQAQLRFRDEPTQGRHAHGYVHQTLADLGLLGLAASLAALVAWLLATARTLASAAAVASEPGRRSAPGCWRWPWWRSCSACTRRSTGPGSSRRSRSPACSAPAGSPAGGRLRSPLRAPRPSTPAPARLQMPRGRALRGRAALAAGAVVLAGLAAVAVAQPWRADDEGDEALALLDEGDFAGARAAADRAHDINPLSVEPYFEQAEIERAAGRPRRATRPLEDAVRLEPASPEAWRRLGESLRRRRSISRRVRSRCCARPVPGPDLGAEPRRISGGAARPWPEACGGPCCRPRRGSPPGGPAEGPRGARRTQAAARPLE